MLFTFIWTRAIAAGATLFAGLAPAASAFPQGATPPSFATLTAAAPTLAAAPRSAAAQTGMLPIPAGAYRIGRDDGPASERPGHRVDLAAFRIDRTEVTNAAFAEYLNALDIDGVAPFAAGAAVAANMDAATRRLLTEGERASGLYPIIALDDAQALIGHNGARFVAAPGYERHPVTETTWAGARAYCGWRGAALPTEAQWEAAARGRNGGVYPWGDAPPTDDRVFVSRRTGETAAVGSRPAGASPFGALDMSGSMAEWTSSLKRAYPYDAADGREAPDQAGERVTRGGDYVFDTAAEKLTTTHRDGFSNAPARGHRHIGFRCAAPG